MRAETIAPSSGWAGRLRGLVLKISGMPDYQAYRAHLRVCHPDRPIPSERQFFEEYLRFRYEGGATPCC